jgi:hypothetical protein
MVFSKSDNSHGSEFKPSLPQEIATNVGHIYKLPEGISLLVPRNSLRSISNVSLAWISWE